ncbi:Uncharacterised protein [Mycobacteroides abscessus]|uniref:hypothetical protein n=1 Tax=Mycobacteroides abscessus TaxID=36809 RepID=UPI0005E45293|nr:hypothetical protein [Mycobacteroides abscessus]CPS10742.1 Uncharacterised protein [Mycobacteroides abscessus]CPS50416.1 Uncharacterised protein [Mycobacteroides abscessus]CPS93801.1 Uncharacterised protein [Mycobacteroides abscessus]CPS94194.1 Uncharacterised protein [Mycobacteroides abscessus]CPT61848.1 Uncharacterised protein [Mycobacteroides abscessus]
MSEDRETWTKGTAALYRRAGRELAWDPRVHSAAGVIIYGLHAEALYRWRTGETTAESLDGVKLELLDPLATYAAAHVGTYRMLCTADWVERRQEWLHQRVQELIADPPPADTVEEAAYRTVATQKALAVAGDHHVPRAVLAGAAAVARLRRHSRSDAEGSTEDQIEAMARHDPAIAAAWEDLDEAGRRGPGNWVIDQWDAICEAAEELAGLTVAATAPVTIEQRVAIVRHEVRHGMMRRAHDPEFFEGRESGRRAALEYTESVAEGLARWEAAGGDPDGADAAMVAHVDADPAAIAAEVDTLITAGAREKLRSAIRARWAQLALPS